VDPTSSALSNSQVPENQPVKSKKETGGLTVILSVFLLVATAIAALLLYQNQKLIKEIKEYQVNSVVQSPTPMATSDPTANWKTYTNTKEGVEFKYPETWTAKSLDGWALNVFLESRPFVIPEASEILTSISVGFNQAMDTTTNQKFYSEKTLAEGVIRIKELFTPESVKTQDLTVGGKQATQISGIWGPGMLEGRYFVYTLVQMDNRLLDITLSNKDNEDIYQKMLFTFKFTD
jgi:hypothetical protein